MINILGPAKFRYCLYTVPFYPTFSDKGLSKLCRPRSDAAIWVHTVIVQFRWVLSFVSAWHFWFPLAKDSRGAYRMVGLYRRYRPSTVYPFSNNFYKTAMPVSIWFHMQPCDNGGTKFCSNVPDHLTKITAMPKYSKNLKNLIFQKRWADCLETWYVASSNCVLPSLFKWWTCADLFYGKVKFGPFGFWMRKR